MPKATPFRQFSKATKEGSFVGFSIILRLLVGSLFIYAGYTKVMAEKAWSASGYLANATGPFAEWFQALAGNVVIDNLNMYGLLLIGLAVFFGLLIRPAAAFGALLMVLYYFADFVGNTAHGYVDEHLVYAVIFLMFVFGGFGHICGLDSIMSQQKFVRKSWLKKIF
jgi:thiosulfate dehydrogenase (quinone) large subunit